MHDNITKNHSIGDLPVRDLPVRDFPVRDFPVVEADSFSTAICNSFYTLPLNIRATEGVKL